LLIRFTVSNSASHKAPESLVGAGGKGLRVQLQTVLVRSRGSRGQNAIDLAAAVFDVDEVGGGDG
jgi:hypothetical protein